VPPQDVSLLLRLPHRSCCFSLPPAYSFVFCRRPQAFVDWPRTPPAPHAFLLPPHQFALPRVDNTLECTRSRIEQQQRHFGNIICGRKSCLRLSPVRSPVSPSVNSSFVTSVDANLHLGLVDHSHFPTTFPSHPHDSLLSSLRSPLLLLNPSRTTGPSRGGGSYRSDRESSGRLLHVDLGCRVRRVGACDELLGSSLFFMFHLNPSDGSRRRSTTTANTLEGMVSLRSRPRYTTGLPQHSTTANLPLPRSRTRSSSTAKAGCFFLLKDLVDQHRFVQV
jgi:hypothetical protein